MGSSDSAGGALTKETTAVTLASSAFSSSASWTNCNAGLTASKWHHHANAITPNWNRPIQISHCDLTTSNNAVWDYLRQPVASESHFSASWTSPQKVVVLLTQRRGSAVAGKSHATNCPPHAPQTPRNDGSLKDQAEFLLGNEGQVAHCFNVEEYSNGPFRK